MIRGNAARKRRGQGGYAAVVRAAIVAALVAAGLVVTPGAGQAAPSLPPGFAVRDMPSGQSELLTDFAYAPDGSYFTTGKNGRVAWVSADGGTVRTLAHLPVVTVQDLGLNGIAVAHDYATSKVIYLARTLMVNNQWTMRLSAAAVQGATPTSLAPERVIWDLPIGSDVHTITGIVAAPDGTLWVTMGDAADFRFVDPAALRSLDVDTGYGKLLHVTPDGRGVASNPFYDAAAPSSWRSRVYASGFRSPFRVSLDPATGAPLVGDVGWNTWEEINLVRPGASYGWPCWEGDGPTPGYRDLPGCAGKTNTAPLYAYPHGPMGTSVTGGIVYTGSAYPEQYRGAYFFGDYASQRVYTLRYDDQGRLVRQPEAGGFGVQNGLPVKFGAAENGDIVYADIGSSRLKRLVHAAGNRPPTAEAVITNDPASARSFTFDASRSFDLDGDALTFAWDFGDGRRVTGVRVTHTYEGTSTAPVTARLTVTDSMGATGTATLTVVPGNRVPALSLTAPPSSERYVVGERVRLSASAVDAEDGPLPVTWSVVLVHCSGGYCHDHPGISFTGDVYDVPFEDHGDDTRLQITATAVDRAGVRAEQIFIALPQLRTLTVVSTPPSPVTVNGVPRASVEVTAGARVSVSAPAVAGDGVAFFAGWSDGQPRERLVVMPDADLTLRAQYVTPIDARYSSDAAVRAVLGAPVAAERGDTTLRARDYTGGRMYWTPEHGAHEVHGSIFGAFDRTGAEGRWGAPRTDELRTPDGRGRLNAFTKEDAHFYWTPTTGAHEVHGAIFRLWRSMGFERSVHGYPRSDEWPTPGMRGRFNNFENGGIYWLPGVGAHSVHGAIHAKWGQHRYEQGHLGFPTTSEWPTPGGVGRFNHFEGGSVYWTPGTGAHEVRGAIRARWAALGWEQSYLGFPTSDEFSVAGGRRTNFERGYITWTAATGRVVDRRY
ncbi:PQQ-dependent sugar dehydrogenase [Blastococcus goldschmidtiae]|uniref:PQQ-dependent sugar dehydrogenase n=1 Tax=Blastococcus goldschmidtiae TaxID=3075546 RepID=A0ABU2K6D2_9ACTN|nr:PQQ-dependent sugar dehydrogenase [Blastococcus sp. DSM 46792]MDT0275735.1 PQQ-dependent sugar dehydrogenase [Blastococcus sp. DSM 46792]